MKFKINTVASKQMSLQKAKAIEKRQQEALKRRQEALKRRLREQEQEEAFRLAVLAELLRQSGSGRSPRLAQQRRNNNNSRR